MNSSNPTSTQPLQQVRSNKIFHAIFSVVSFLGFADATYLTIAHYNSSPLRCGAHGGCDVVTNSAYADIFGIPVALLGALYYLTVFLLCIAYIDKKNETILRMISYLTVSGMIASLYFVSLQLFVINAICYYCMVSAATSTTLFATGMTYLYKNKKRALAPVTSE